MEQTKGNFTIILHLCQQNIENNDEKENHESAGQTVKNVRFCHLYMSVQPGYNGYAETSVYEETLLRTESDGSGGFQTVRDYKPVVLF